MTDRTEEAPAPPVNIFLGLGGNVGDRRALLRQAVQALRLLLDEVRVSALYESAPWGVTDQPPFLNAAARAQTTLPPLQLLDALLQIEDDLGRVRGAHWGPRAIDLDLLLYGAHTIDHPRLTVPHPYLKERSFVLRPLADLAPGLTLPTGELVGELLTTIPQDDLTQLENAGWAD